MNAKVLGRQNSNFIAAAVALGSNIGGIWLELAWVLMLNNFAANWLCDGHNRLKIDRITGKPLVPNVHLTQNMELQVHPILFF